MARINEKDLWKYSKIDTQFNNHYLNSAYNDLVDFVEGKKEHQEMVMHTLMNSVVTTVEDVRKKEEEIKKLNKYIAYLQEQNKELINK